MISRILRKPLKEMQTKVNDLLAGNQTTDLKYMIYSAHDDQIVNMLNFLEADFKWVPFASTVTFELKYQASCLAEPESASADCFGVSVRSNGNPLLFDGCSGDNFTLEGCSWPEFHSLMQRLWYSGPGAPDLDAACSETPEPAPTK